MRQTYRIPVGTMALYMAILLHFICVIKNICSLPVCELDLKNTLNTCQCSPLDVSSVREITGRGWNGTLDLLPGVEYWTDAILAYTPWTQYGGCWLTSKPKNVLEKSGIRLSTNHPITECLQYVKNTSFYLWKSRCFDKESVENLIGNKCTGIPCNSTSKSICLTGQQDCVCRYDITDLPMEPEIGNCKSVSYSFEGDSNDTWKTTLHTVNCDSTLPFYCIGLDSSRKKIISADNTSFSVAAQLCSSLDLDFASTNGIQLTPIDFRNHFPNISRSFWTSIFREEMLILGDDKHVYDAKNCLTVKVYYNQTVPRSFKICPNAISCIPNLSTATDDSTNTTSEIDLNRYFFILFVLVAPITVIACCISRRHKVKKSTGYPHTSRKYLTGQCMEELGEDRSTTQTRYSSHGTQSRPDAMPIVGVGREEEPHYIEMKKPEESVYVTLELRIPVNRSKPQ